MRSVLAACVTLALAGLAPAQFYPYNAAADGTKVGILYDAAGQHAGVQPPGGAAVALQDPPGLTAPSGYAISANALWAGGNAGGWYTITSGGSMFTSYSLQPVRWNVATRAAEVLPVEPYTYFATVDVIQPDGSAVGRLYTWFGMQSKVWPAPSPAMAVTGAKSPAAPAQPVAGPVVPHAAMPQPLQPSPLAATASCAGGQCATQATAPARRTGPVRRLLGW